MKFINKAGLALMALPGIAAAQSDLTIDRNAVDVPPTGDPVSGLIYNIIDFVFMFAAVLAVLFIIIGGIRYIISAGNPDQAGAARKTIIYAVIGLIIIILSFLIVRIIISGGSGFLS